MARRHALRVLASLGTVLAGLALTSASFAQDGVALTAIPIPTAGGKTLAADILDVDQQAHRLYVTDKASGGVDVFDVTTPTAKFVKTIPTSDDANGITVANAVHKLYTGLSDGTVAIIDINVGSPTYETVIAQPNTQGEGRADEMDFNPVDLQLWVANSEDHFVSVIDGRTDQIIAQIDGLGPLLEQFRFNAADGMMYLSGSDGTLYKFDPKRLTLVQTWTLDPTCTPNGLAINPVTNQALLGCRNRTNVTNTEIWDLAAGRVVQRIEEFGGMDGGGYYPVADRFIMYGSLPAPSIGIFSGGPDVRLLATVPLPARGNVAFDETNRIVYAANQSPNQPSIWSFPLPA
ncbi:MAG: hypothetical protein QOF51_1107 [Chloroflexota bacterium]|jgi:YVTN family beta-propeller protein|nr:hypothetical protein [Chloroflexota bacterium]